MDMTVNAEVQTAAQPVNALPAHETTGIRLGALYLDKQNVRKVKGKMPIPDLAAAIKRQTLLQNLVVVAKKGKKKGQTHAVIAGGRRYEALMLLVEWGDITLDWIVPCKLVAAENATSASLTENVAREAMHPADELDAFAKLLAEGQSFETIGNTFGVSAMTVRRRIKLLSVSPKLLNLLRSDEISLDQLGAISLNDSHEVQEQVWEECQHSDWMSTPDHLRARLTAEEIDITKSTIAKFVGVEAFEAAGGLVRRDLFSSDDSGYIVDAALLYRLADEKLNAQAEALRAEGWSWVETRQKQDHTLYSRLGRLTAAIVIPDDIKPQVEALANEITSLAAEIDAFHEGEDESDEAYERNEEREERCNALEQQKDELETACMQWTLEQKAVAGVVVYINHSGMLVKEYGLVRQGDRPVDNNTGETMIVKDQYGREKKPKAKSAHSDKMVARLTAHRTIAVQAEMTKRPDVALAVLTATLATDVFHHYHEHSLKVRPSPVDFQLTNAADDMADSPNWQAMNSDKETWSHRLPRSASDLLPWLLRQDAETVKDLMAFCVARCIDGVRQTERLAAPMDRIAEALELDMTDHWTATEESYFGHISKNQMIAAVTEAVSAEEAAPLAGLKKDAAAKAAERSLRGVRWVPEPMRPRAIAQAEADNEDADQEPTGDDA